MSELCDGEDEEVVGASGTDVVVMSGFVDTGGRNVHSAKLPCEGGGTSGDCVRPVRAVGVGAALVELLSVCGGGCAMELEETEM